MSLSKLRLRLDSTLWDVGAGCGSLTIEAAGLACHGAVYAIERSPAQVSLLKQNVETHGVAGVVTVIEGEAPAALRHLARPDVVFVGGSGGTLLEIFDVAYDRLVAGGRIVANLATIEHLTASLHWAGGRGVEPEVVQVSVSRGSAILGLTRLAAENPIFVVTLEKPA